MKEIERTMFRSGYKASKIYLVDSNYNSISIFIREN